MVKDRRLQIRVSQELFNELLKKAILLDLSLSAFCRLKLQGKQIFKAVAEND